MSDISAPPPFWREALRINVLATGGVLAACYGWTCWQMASPEYWGFWLVAVLSLLGGAFQLGLALWKTLILIRDHHRWKRYVRQGVDPRADHMATDKDLRDGGYME